MALCSFWHRTVFLSESSIAFTIEDDRYVSTVKMIEPDHLLPTSALSHTQTCCYIAAHGHTECLQPFSGMWVRFPLLLEEHIRYFYLAASSWSGCVVPQVTRNHQEARINPVLKTISKLVILLLQFATIWEENLKDLVSSHLWNEHVACIHIWTFQI